MNDILLSTALDTMLKKNHCVQDETGYNPPCSVCVRGAAEEQCILHVLSQGKLPAFEHY